MNQTNCVVFPASYDVLVTPLTLHLGQSTTAAPEPRTPSGDALANCCTFWACTSPVPWGAWE